MAFFTTSNVNVPLIPREVEPEKRLQTTVPPPTGITVPHNVALPPTATRGLPTVPVAPPTTLTLTCDATIAVPPSETMTVPPAETIAAPLTPTIEAPISSTDALQTLKPVGTGNVESSAVASSSERDATVPSGGPACVLPPGVTPGSQSANPPCPIDCYVPEISSDTRC